MRLSEAHMFAKFYAAGPFSYLRIGRFRNHIDNSEVRRTTVLRWGFAADGHFVMHVVPTSVPQSSFQLEGEQNALPQ